MSTALTEQFRERITVFEKILASVPGAKIGHEMDEELCPLKHTFADGCYIREIFMPAGVVLTSKIHKILHPFFVLKGRCTVATEEGTVEITAPYYGLTKPGTKRALIIHEDTVWVTVHVTKSRDVEEIENEIIAPTWECFEKYQKTLLPKEVGI